MKKELIWSVIVAVALGGLVVYFAVSYSNSGENNYENRTTNQSASSLNKFDQILLSSSEVSKHSSQADCWIIISGKVYSVSSYINTHPGGASAIASFCGKDATRAFDTKGGKGSHSGFAQGLLAQYVIGDVGSQASSDKIQALQNSATASPKGGDSEYEDD